MSVSLMKADRTPFRSPGLFEGTLTEKAAAAESYVSYSGRYELTADKVFHDVTMSLFPNWVGTRQERLYKFENNRLLLFTPPFIMNSEEQSAFLIWERA